MNAKSLVFVTCVEAIRCVLLYNLHDCTFKGPLLSEIKMLFISCKKLFLFLRYLHFCANELIRKLRLISKFMTSQAEQQMIIIMNILSNISKLKGNQSMKIGRLMEYNVRNIFS